MKNQSINTSSDQDRVLTTKEILKTSTEFRTLPLGSPPSPPIRMADLGRLERSGVQEHQNQAVTANKKCLTDGKNCLWVYGDDNGLVAGITKHGTNDPENILNAIADEFYVAIVSKHEPRRLVTQPKGIFVGTRV